MHDTIKEPTDHRPRSRNPGVALTLLCIAQLMLILDLTAVNIALPTIGAELGLSSVQATAVVTTYAVAFGGLMLLGGRLADDFGRRRTLMVGTVVFTLSSLLCGVADDAGVLILGRALQGVGAALMSPAALAALTGLFHGAARVRALSVWAGIGAAGFAGGLAVSGVLTDGPGWRWIFLANLPVGLLVLLVLPAYLGPDPRRERQPSDAIGALLTTGTFGALVYGLSVLGEPATDPVWALVGLSAAVVGAVLLLLHQSRHPAPTVPARVLRQRPVLTGLFVMLVASAGMLSIFFLTTMYAQVARGMDALEAGLLFLPSAVATMAAAHLAGHVINHHGTKAVAIVGFLLTAAGAAVLAGVEVDSSLWGRVIPGLVLTSLGLGPNIVVATSTTLARIRDEDAGIASGIVNIGHETGGALGLAAMVAALGTSLTSASAAAYGDGFRGIAVGAVLMAILAAVIVPSLRPESRHLGHGHG
jgi:EmrB/QacA subfamily drug resistance transporter